ncbi:hypothetical protein JRQ81_010512, partial [Phrynocephalus forsythii]
GNISNVDIVMESDEGTFMPTGLAFTGSDNARSIITEIMKLLKPINVTKVYENGGGTDINYWIHDGVPVPSRPSAMVPRLLHLLQMPERLRNAMSLSFDKLYF